MLFAAPFPVRQRKDRAAASCHRHQLIHDAMEPDDGWRGAFIEMAMDRFAHIRPQFLPCFRLRHNRMAKRPGHETPVHFVLNHLENDFGSHGPTMLAYVDGVKMGRHRASWTRSPRNWTPNCGS